MDRNYLEELVKMQIPGPTLRVSDSVGLEICALTKSPGAYVAVFFFWMSVHKAYGLPPPGCHWARVLVFRDW